MARLPLVSPLDRALFLKAQPYLDGLESNVLATLASFTEERHYASGTVIRAQSAPVDRICFLGSGAVDITDAASESAEPRCIEAPGAVGLAHYFASSPHPPEVLAVQDTLCLELSTMDLTQILEDHFPLLLQMALTSCEQAMMTFAELKDARPPEQGFEDTDRSETPAQLDLVERLALSKRAPFFEGTNLTVLAELIRFDQPRVVAQGEALWRTGDPIDRMALVLDGSFQTEGNHGVCDAPSGAMLGAWEILVAGPRSEGWVAKVASRVLSIERELFTDVLEDHFEFAQSYLERLSSKVVDGWGCIQQAHKD